MAVHPAVRQREESAVPLGGDAVAIGDLGPVRIALALAGLFEGQTPESSSRRRATSPHATQGGSTGR